MMMRGGKVLLLSGCLAATGCATDQAVQVRAIADPNSKLHYNGGLLADARAQLAIGAVGLAIESFRTLQRQQPDNVEVYAGLAACYAAMGRYDLTRTNYELALAYAPNDPALLQALASTLDKLGETEQAVEVRSEIRTAAVRAAQPSLAPPPVTPLGVPRATSMTVKLPEASRSPAIAQSSDPAIARPRLGPTKVDLATARLPSIGKPALTANNEIAIPLTEYPSNASWLAQEHTERSTNPQLLRAPAVELHAARASLVSERTLGVNGAIAVNEVADGSGTAQTHVESSINGQLRRATVVGLHAARASLVSERALDVNGASVVSEIASPPQPGPLPGKIESRVAQAAPIRKAPVESDDATTTEHGPYLERTSLREVALITIAHPANRTTLRSRPPELPRMAVIAAPPADRPPRQPMPQALLAAASVRWVPLRYASHPQSIELLNAARADGLAARTRIALVDRGWRKVRIGNARAVRQHSLVLYAAGRWHVAARLAAQLRCKAVRTASVKNVIVLLGRDAASRRGAISRG